MGKSEHVLQEELRQARMTRLIADLEEFFVDNDVDFRTAAEASAAVLTKLGTIQCPRDSGMVEIIYRPSCRYVMPL